MSGGAPFLLTNVVPGRITYGDMNNVIAVLDQPVIAPEAGNLLIRLYYNGVVAKRAGAPSCLVTVGVRRDQEGVSLVEQNTGIRAGTAAERMELAVGGTLAARIGVAAGERIVLHIEIRRADPECAPAGAGGPEQIAQIFGQLEILFSREQLLSQ